MFSHKVYWTGVPLALLAAGCIIVPGSSSLGGMGAGSSATFGRSGTPLTGSDQNTTRSDTTRPIVAATAGPRDATVPVIAALSASPTTLTQPGQEVVFHIEAVDASGTPAYTWTATGGTLTATVGTRVGWRSPEKPGRYTVLVIVTSPSGGATTGAVNIEVKNDGSGRVGPASLPDADSTAPPAPSATPAVPAPTPTP